MYISQWFDFLMLIAYWVAPLQHKCCQIHITVLYYTVLFIIISRGFVTLVMDMDIEPT